MRAFRPDGEGKAEAEKEEESVRKCENSKESGLVELLKSAFWKKPSEDKVRDALEKLEEKLFSVSCIFC